MNMAIVLFLSLFTLSWQPNSEPDLAKYTVYVDLDGIGPFEFMVDVALDTFYLFEQGDNELRRFAVTASDTAGNESDFSRIVTVNTRIPAAVDLKARKYRAPASGWENRGSELELLVDGVDVNWGSFSPEHEYKIEGVGRGAPIRLQVNDDWYPDNDLNVSEPLRYVLEFDGNVVSTEIDVNGETTETPVIPQGIEYTLTVKGTYRFWNTERPELEADAEYNMRF